MKREPRWQVLPYLSDAEIERRFSDAELNAGWLQEMAEGVGMSTAARAHYRAELVKEQRRIDELKRALSERGLLL